MVEIYADDTRIFDSRLPETQILELKTSETLNKAGTAVFTLPPDHQAYDAAVNPIAVITIFEDGELAFRGRMLYPQDDFQKRRTITCEGELNFFRDSIHRPYLYQGTPETIFRAVVAVHNAQCDRWKQFSVGAVTVTDANNYIRLESSKAKPVSDVLSLLLERCGGYFVFTSDDDDDDQRCISWLAEFGAESTQVVRFGENLLDLMRTVTYDKLCTRIIPYGAVDEETDDRLTIASVNNGCDYIEDTDAIAKYGTITRAVYWDDVTLPENLLRKAQEYLSTNSDPVSSIELSAVDLHLTDKDIRSFHLGDYIPADSKPHGLKESFRLMTKERDWFYPSNGRIVFGRETTMTGAQIGSQSADMSDLQYAEQTAKKAAQSANSNSQQLDALLDEIIAVDERVTAEIQALADRVKVLEEGRMQ